MPGFQQDNAHDDGFSDLYYVMTGRANSGFFRYVQSLSPTRSERLPDPSVLSKLRYLQTLVVFAAEKYSSRIFPISIHTIGPFLKGLIQK